jgi:hypothetical protein
VSSLILALACVAFAIVLSRLIQENAALKAGKEVEAGRAFAWW